MIAASIDNPRVVRSVMSPFSYLQRLLQEVSLSWLVQYQALALPWQGIQNQYSHDCMIRTHCPTQFSISSRKAEFSYSQAHWRIPYIIQTNHVHHSVWRPASLWFHSSVDLMLLPQIRCGRTSHTTRLEDDKIRQKVMLTVVTTRWLEGTPARPAGLISDEMSSLSSGRWS